MQICRLFLLLTVFPFAILNHQGLAGKSPLNGQKLQIIWTRWPGNPKGLSGTTKGGLIIDYLSARFNFTYEMIRVKELTLEPTKNGRGLFNYLWDGQCDLLVAAVVPSSQRLSVLDLTWPYTNDVVSFLIPVADHTANINAVIKPFQWPVWILLAIATMCVIFVLKLIAIFLESNQINKNIEKNNEKEGLSSKRLKRRRTNTSKNHYLYVFGILLSQGGPCPSDRLSFRITAGIWVLAAFVFVQAYQSTLIIYVIAPTLSPLINSANDIAKRSDITIVVKKGGTFESLMRSSNNSLFRKLQTRMDNSQCVLTPECVSLITRGSRNVFPDAKSLQQQTIWENYKRTKKCNLEVARDDFISMIGSFALPKGSPYTQSVSKGLLEIHEIGLKDFWESEYPSVSTRYCMENMQKGHVSTPRKKPPALTLQNLTGAFIALFVGLGLSLLVFLYELVSSTASSEMLLPTADAKLKSEASEAFDEPLKESLQFEVLVSSIALCEMLLPTDAKLKSESPEAVNEPLEESLEFEGLASGTQLKEES